MPSQKPLTLHLDFRSGLPIYIQIINQIEQQVSGGMLKAWRPVAYCSCVGFGIAHQLQHRGKSLPLLDDAGVISTQQGRGTYILVKPPPGVEKKLREETLEALARQYIGEGKRLNFSDAELNQMVRDQLKSWKETQSDNE